MGKIVNVCNAKGGCGKSTTVVNLSVALSKLNKKILAIDNDSQSDLTKSLGIEPDPKKNNLADLMSLTIEEAEPAYNIDDYITHTNGIDIIPSSIRLAAIETRLVNAYSREHVLSSILETVRERYDYIIIDNQPSLSLLTINSLAASDSVVIPLETHYLCCEGLEIMLDTIAQVKKKLNPKLTIEGIILTMYQSRTNLCRSVKQTVEKTYGENIHIFSEPVKYSIKAAEQSVAGVSIFDFDAKSDIAVAYETMAKELLSNA